MCPPTRQSIPSLTDDDDIHELYGSLFLTVEEALQYEKTRAEFNNRVRCQVFQILISFD